MFRKQIVLLFAVAFLIMTQASCTLDKPEQFQTSVGIIQRAEEIEQSGTYKMGWLPEGILEKLLEEAFEKLLSGSRYYFIPTSDLSTVGNLVKIKNVRCYPYGYSRYRCSFTNTGVCHACI